MKKLILLFFACFAFSFVGLSETIKIGNTTANTIYVHIRFNDGTDCETDDELAICILPGASQIVTLPGVTFAVQVYEECPPTFGSMSWRHNPFMGCTVPPVENIDPFAIEWGHTPTSPIQWSLNITL